MVEELRRRMENSDTLEAKLRTAEDTFAVSPVKLP